MADSVCTDYLICHMLLLTYSFLHCCQFHHVVPHHLCNSSSYQILNPEPIHLPLSPSHSLKSSSGISTYVVGSTHRFIRGKSTFSCFLQQLDVSSSPVSKYSIYITSHLHLFFLLSSWSWGPVPAVEPPRNETSRLVGSKSTISATLPDVSTGLWLELSPLRLLPVKSGSASGIAFLSCGCGPPSSIFLRVTFVEG